MKCIEIHIIGNLQKRGLAFRSMNEASKYSLSGKAKYKAPNILLIEIEGSVDQLEHMLSWLSSLKLEDGISEVNFKGSELKDYKKFEIGN